MTQIEVHIPETAENSISDGLRELTRQICLKTDQNTAFGLSGEYGYAIDYETDVFFLRPECWCGEDKCKKCSGEIPNFLFKPNHAYINFYKYIGRSQEVIGELPHNWLQQCLQSFWQPGDCYYEISAHDRNLYEGLSGRQDPAYVEFCFDVYNPQTILQAELSPFATEPDVFGWDMDMLISDVANAQLKYGKEYKKLVKLDRKYPALRKKIKTKAITYHQHCISWHQDRLKELV